MYVCIAYVCTVYGIQKNPNANYIIRVHLFMYTYACIYVCMYVCMCIKMFVSRVIASLQWTMTSCGDEANTPSNTE